MATGLKKNVIVIAGFFVAVLYALNTWNSFTSDYGLQPIDLQVNDRRSPDENAAVIRKLIKMGCGSGERCKCAHNTLYASTSRAQRALVAFEGDYWQLLFLGKPAGISLVKRLRGLGIGRGEIDALREQGKLKFSAAISACKENAT